MNQTEILLLSFGGVALFYCWFIFQHYAKEFTLLHTTMATIVYNSYFYQTGYKNKRCNASTISVN